MEEAAAILGRCAESVCARVCERDTEGEREREGEREKVGGIKVRENITASLDYAHPRSSSKQMRC